MKFVKFLKHFFYRTPLVAASVLTIGYLENSTTIDFKTFTAYFIFKRASLDWDTFEAATGGVL